MNHVEVNENTLEISNEDINSKLEDLLLGENFESTNTERLESICIDISNSKEKQEQEKKFIISLDKIYKEELLRIGYSV